MFSVEGESFSIEHKRRIVLPRLILSDDGVSVVVMIMLIMLGGNSDGSDDNDNDHGNDDIYFPQPADNFDFG